MLGRALDSHTSASTKAHSRTIQRTLQSNSFATNTSTPLESNKRKFDRTLSNASSLGAIHEHLYFDENELEAAVDLTASPPRHGRTNVHYPSLEERGGGVIQYPSLPLLPPHQEVPPSSAQGQWSESAPPVVSPYFATPPKHLPAPSPETSRPAKRRTLPWPQKESSTSSTPPSKDTSDGPQYPWNKTTSAVKEEQKELRRRNKVKASASMVQPELSDKGVVSQVPSTFLSDEQKSVVKAVIDDGKSVFFTGSAGTGKSVLMRAIIAKLKHKYRREPDRVAITASTGLAACVIEGGTLHSWAGIGLGKEPAPELVKKIRRNAKIKAKWLRTKVLIIDEVSMVDGELFDKLEHVARSIRNNGRPFGGIQLVVTGDFFQLPPVPDRNSVAKFAFEAATWNTCIAHTILLTHVFRQKDPEFAGMLNEMRLGKLSPTTIRAFQSLSRPLDFRDEVEATELFPTRIEVDNANTTRMQNLSGQLMTYNAVDSGTTDLNVRSKVLANFMAPEVLQLKKGAQVMLIKNIDSQLVNGSLGKVHSFMDENTFGVYKVDEESFLRAHEPEGGSDEDEKATARKYINAMRLKNSSEGAAAPPSPLRYWPMVRFALPDGTSRDMLCQPEEWKTENQQGEVIAKRVQVPLILAWALSIHKAQGQTLSRVKVDLGKVFEKGQAYVALSRATSQAGLQVLRFDHRKVMVHPRVTQFYSKLASVESLAKTTVSKTAGTTTEPDYEQQYLDGIDDEELAYMCG